MIDLFRKRHLLESLQPTAYAGHYFDCGTDFTDVPSGSEPSDSRSPQGSATLSFWTLQAQSIR